MLPKKIIETEMFVGEAKPLSLDFRWASKDLRWAASVSDVDVRLYHQGCDVSATYLIGAPSFSGNIIKTPRIEGLRVGLYTMAVSANVGGNREVMAIEIHSIPIDGRRDKYICSWCGTFVPDESGNCPACGGWRDAA